jgi:hypothetical protein
LQSVTWSFHPQRGGSAARAGAWRLAGPRFWRRAAGALASGVAFAGCAPALEWRDVRLPDTALVAQLPCRPGRFGREVRIAGRPLQLFMLSCEAGGVTYGVATAEVGDPAQVPAVLDELAGAAVSSLRASEPRFAPYTLDGATPFAGNVSARLRGVRPDGQAVEESIRVFARGTRVFQASAIGEALPAAGVHPFEAGLRFDLETRKADPS